MRLHPAVSLLAATVLSSCFVLDDAHLEELADASTETMTDAPAVLVPLVDDRCGVGTPRAILSRSTLGIRIDTRSMNNDLTSSCGGAATLGNDGFIAVDVQAGEYWHFHLQNDPADPASADRHPALFMLHAPSGSCDARDCRFNSDACDAVGDEHFGFVADAPGRWYLGIDDRTDGGGQYILDAIRPECGDGAKDHGEACDDGNRDDGDGCNSSCLRELSLEAPNELEPNDNPTEANFVRMGGADFTLTGSIGGEGACRYADTFAIDVPPGARVEVDALQATGDVCSEGTLTAGFQLALRNAAHSDVVSGMTDASECAIVRSPVLAGGLYYVTVLLPAEAERPLRYRLRLRVSGS